MCDAHTCRLFTNISYSFYYRDSGPLRRWPCGVSLIVFFPRLVIRVILVLLIITFITFITVIYCE